MNTVLRLSLVALLAASSVSAHAEWYAKFGKRPVEGIANNDLVPRPGDPYVDDDGNGSFVKGWTTSGDADDRPTEEVSFYYTPLTGQSPTITPSGWSIDTVFNFTYSVDLRRGNDPFTTHTGAGAAHVVGTAPLGSEPRVFAMEMLSFDISGAYNGVSPFLIRESPTIVSPGQVTIETLPGGQFRMDSFFDVFTEMSVDGGQTWFTMTPEPSSAALMALAAVAATMCRKRRK